MRTKPIKIFLIPLLLVIVSISNAQSLYIANGGSIVTTGNAKIVVLNGNVQAVGNGSITGTGTLVMSGTVAATLDMQGNSVPNLEIDNSAGVSLLSNVRVTEGGTFTTGKLTLGAFDLILDSDALAFTGGATGKFFETNGTGQVKKELAGAIANYDFPLGIGTSYRPLRLNTTAGTYVSAIVGVQNKSGASSLKPPTSSHYLITHWPITRSGISGATVTAEGTYLDPADIVGTEVNIKGNYHNGSSWSEVGEGSDDVNNKVSMPISAAAGVLTGFAQPVALPLNLLSFGGEQNNGNVKLTWKTTDEVNVDHFLISKSEDDQKFNSIGMVKATGFRNEITTYNFTTDQKEALAYYRLKMVDIDGSFKFSKILALKNNDEAHIAMSVSPNPAYGDIVKVKYTSNVNTGANLSLLSANGSVISTQLVSLTEGLNNMEITGLSPLTQGLYMVRIKTDSGAITNMKLLK